MTVSSSEYKNVKSSIKFDPLEKKSILSEKMILLFDKGSQQDSSETQQVNKNANFLAIICDLKCKIPCEWKVNEHFCKCKVDNSIRAIYLPFSNRENTPAHEVF